MKVHICIKTTGIFIFLFTFMFSLSAFGEVGDLIKCDSLDVDYDLRLDIVQKDPSNLTKIYHLGVDAFCTEGRQKEGIRHIENASNGGHIPASIRMALYYRTDGTLDSSSKLTKDPVNFDKMLFYYERAAAQIEAAPNYPKGTTEDMPEIEEHNKTSARTFATLPSFYFNGYSRAIMDILRNGNTEYMDTDLVLDKMRVSAERCLRRPSLTVWKNQREAIAHALQVRCQAMWDFASDALLLEEDRIKVAKNCSVTLRECPEHQNIMDQLTRLVKIMRSQKKSVPLI